MAAKAKGLGKGLGALIPLDDGGLPGTRQLVLQLATAPYVGVIAWIRDGLIR